MRKATSYAINFDLKSGYHHVDIHADYWQYLGFSWKGKDGAVVYYMFRVLPFGLATAPFVFTKLPLVKRWRNRGLKIVLYVDDGICMCGNEQATSQAAQMIRQDLGRAGFVINEEKSDFEPRQKVTWLGFSLDIIMETSQFPSNVYVNYRKL